MANMSNYLENKLVDFLWRGGSFTPPATVYVALCTATPTDVSTGSTITEVSGGNYSRKAITTTTSNFYSTQGDTTSTSSGTNGTTSNVNAVTWNGITWSATVTSLAICDASSSGNMLFWGALGTSRTPSSGDSVTFDVSAISVQLDN